MESRVCVYEQNRGAQRSLFPSFFVSTCDTAVARLLAAQPRHRVGFDSCGAP